MKKKISFIVTAMMIVSATLAGCGESSSSDSYAKMAEPDMAYAEEAIADEAYGGFDNGDIYEAGSGEGSYEEPAEEINQSAIDATAKRKLIKTVDLTVETREFDKLMETINAKVSNLGGYIENSNITGNSYGSSTKRDAYIVARIPSESLNSFVTTLEEKSNVTNKSENAEDVTLQYSDTQARISSLKIEQERLNALLEKADTLESIIELENRLTEVRYELESYESRLRSMDNRVDYSTVNLNVFEVVEYTPEPIQELTFGQRLSREFIDGCENAWDTIQDFIIGFVSFLPELLVILVILGIIFLIVFFIVKGIISVAKKCNAQKVKKVKVQPGVATVVATPVDKPLELNESVESKDGQK